MIDNFDPTFFNAVKPPDNAYITDNCVLAFSISDKDSVKPLLRHDIHLVNTLLKENGKYHKMEFLSILYDFLNILDQPLEYNSNERTLYTDIFAIRKLYAIGHFSNQMFRHNYTDFIKAIPPAVRTIMNLYNIYPDNGPISTCAVSYVLSSISYHYKDIKPNMPNYDVFFEIADLAVLFSQIPKSIPNESIILLHNFFLNSLFAFPYDQEVSQDTQNLFYSIIQRVKNAFSEAFNGNFNFVGLSTHLLNFLNSQYYQLKIRYEIFNLIQLIAHHNTIAANFLVEKVNLKIFALFISNVINLENYNFDQSEIIPPVQSAPVQPAGDRKSVV